LPSKDINVAVIDTSVFADYYLLYPGDPERHERARTVLDKLSLRDVIVYEPFLFEIELRAVLVRRIPPEQALQIVDTTL
jgi:predicted nucleic acid-binding protein